MATVIQKAGLDGQLTIQVEPPGPEHESDLANTSNEHHLGECKCSYCNFRNVNTQVLLGENILCVCEIWGAYGCDHGDYCF